VRIEEVETELPRAELTATQRPGLAAPRNRFNAQTGSESTVGLGEELRFALFSKQQSHKQRDFDAENRG
jgi:hypothetical protein